MTAAFLVANSSSDLSRGVDLFDDEPVAILATGRVDAVPALEDDPAESLRGERVAPRAKAPRDVRREPDVHARREHALEMAAALEQRHFEQRFAVDLEQIEGREDAAPAGVPAHGVPLRIHLELGLVEEALHEDTVDDGRVRACVGDDGVVELTRAVDRAVIPDESRAGVADADQRPDAFPLWLEDVAVGFRLLADVAGTLGREVRPDGVLQRWRARVSHPLDRQNKRSKMRTPVPTTSRGSP